jgi:hypothetical protein
MSKVRASGIEPGRRGYGSLPSSIRSIRRCQNEFFGQTGRHISDVASRRTRCACVSGSRGSETLCEQVRSTLADQIERGEPLQPVRLRDPAQQQRNSREAERAVARS